VASRETLKSVCGFTIRNSVNEFSEDVALKMVMLKLYCSDVTAKHSRAMSWNSTCFTMTDERRDGVSREFLRSSEPKNGPAAGLRCLAPSLTLYSGFNALL